MKYYEIPAPDGTKYCCFRFNKTHWGYFYGKDKGIPDNAWEYPYPNKNSNLHEIYEKYVVHLDKPLIQLALL